MPVSNISATSSSPGLFIDFSTRHKQIMGNKTCNTVEIANEINHIVGAKDNIFIHGSNSNSLLTFTNKQRTGELLPAAHQRELGLTVRCGDKVHSPFRFEHGEREHERVFAFKYDTKSTRLSEEAVGEVALYCGYGTEDNEAYPLIYVFSDTGKTMEWAQHIEYMTPKGGSIYPHQIMGIIVPTENVHRVNESLAEIFPKIAVRAFNWI
ncbi:hypothetical protein D5952_14225 [Salmonella enterica subsp. enterica]|nr:hypothetical protein [Salmonella enterica subsp. enterica serovar Bonn]EBZ5939338.1 hypothetical protein [Salmonella enterica subsp. enterica serovar Muenchen]MLZ41081.1 hypothetical protein [Salmonella enterica subsp. enterica serovar Bonn]